MMQRVKIFSGTSGTQLEREINSWIANPENIRGAIDKIEMRTCAAGTNKGYATGHLQESYQHYITIMITYTEPLP